MMISNSYVLLAYMFSLLLFFNFNNPIFFWILMELNLILFMLIMTFSSIFSYKRDSLNYLVFYFIIQSSSSILFLSNFSLGDWMSIFNCDVMFIVCMVFKIGLFPLFFWVFSLSGSVSNFALVSLLSFQKIPLMSGLFHNNSLFLYTLLFFSLAFGSLMVFFSQTFLNMLICSSISYSFMLFFFFSMSSATFIFFFMIYSVFLFLCLSYSESVFWKPSLHVVLFSFLFFLGLPPLGLFFYKFIFSSILFNYLGLTELLFFWAFSFFSMVGYMKFFFHSFFFPCGVYNSPNQGEIALMFFSISFFFFFLLLL